MKILNLVKSFLVVSLVLNSTSVFAQVKKETRANQQKNQGGGDAGGAELTTMAAPLMPGDFKLAIKAAQEHLPAVLRSLELMLVKREFRPDITAYLFANMLTNSKIFGNEPVDISTAESLVLKLNNINVYTESYKVGNTTLGDNRLIDFYRRASEEADYSGHRYEMYQEYTNKLFAHSQIYKIAREVTVEVRKAPCMDENKRPVAASIYASTPNAICLSESKVMQNKLINRNNILPTILGLIIHEFGHKAGIKSEQTMYALQVPLVKAMIEATTFSFADNSVGFLNASVSDRQEMYDEIRGKINQLDHMINNFENYSDLLMCNQVTELAEEAKENYGNTNRKYIRLFWVTHTVQHYKYQTSIFLLLQASKTYCQKSFRRSQDSGVPSELRWVDWASDGNGMKFASIKSIFNPRSSPDDLYLNTLFENEIVVLPRFLVKEDLIKNLNVLKDLYKKDLKELENAKAEGLDHLRFKVNGLE